MTELEGLPNSEFEVVLLLQVRPGLGQQQLELRLLGHTDSYPICVNDRSFGEETKRDALLVLDSSDL